MDVPQVRVYERCRRGLSAHCYEVRYGQAAMLQCMLCALRHRPRMVRSLIIAAIAGTILTAIIQGGLLIHDELAREMAWNVPLTYAVPYGVATVGSMFNVCREMA